MSVRKLLDSERYQICQCGWRLNAKRSEGHYFKLEESCKCPMCGALAVRIDYVEEKGYDMALLDTDA